MSKTIFPRTNWITLSGEVVSAPITRATRGGPKLTTFIIGVSFGSARPARIAVAAPTEMSPELSDVLKVGVEVVVEGQLIPAPVRVGRGLTPLRISATRIQALGADGRSLEIGVSAVATSEETVAQTAPKTADKPKASEGRARSERVRKPRASSAISIRATKTPAASASKVSAVSNVPLTPTASVAGADSSAAKAKKSAVSQHGRQRRRRQPGSELIQTDIASTQHELAASSTADPVSSKGSSKGSLKKTPRATSRSIPKAKSTGRPTKTTTDATRATRRPGKTPTSRSKSSSEGATSGAATSGAALPTKSQTPQVKTRPAAKNQRRSVKPAKSRASSRPAPKPASDSPFTLTQSESSFDPFLVDDKD